MDWMLVSPLHSHVKILALNIDVMKFKGGAFGRELGHEERALMNGVEALKKKRERDQS